MYAAVTQRGCARIRSPPSMAAEAFATDAGSVVRRTVRLVGRADEDPRALARRVDTRTRPAALRELPVPPHQEVRRCPVHLNISCLFSSFIANRYQLCSIMCLNQTDPVRSTGPSSTSVRARPGRRLSALSVP